MLKKRAFVVMICLLLCVLCPFAWAADESDEVYELTIQATGQVPLTQEGKTSVGTALPTVLGLTELDDAIYETIYQGLQQQRKPIEITQTVEISNWGELDDLLKAFGARVIEQYRRVIEDHPRLFYVSGGYGISTNGWGDGSGTVSITSVLMPSYSSVYTQEQIQQFNDTVDGLVEQGRALSTDLEKALFFHDYLVEHVAYNWEAAAGQDVPSMRVYNAYGALIAGNAVCQGYTLAYQLLLGEVGVDSLKVDSDDLNHTWNLVEVDGAWYHVDVTWDDPTPDLPGCCSYDNFLRSDEGIQETGHTAWEKSYSVSVSKEEPEGIFRRSSSQIYSYGGAYYYLSIDMGSGTLYRAASLTDEEPEAVASFTFFRHLFQVEGDDRYYSYPDYGVVWHDGVLYYADAEGRLCSYELDSGANTALCAIPFAAEGSADGIYDSTRDTIGLRYNGEAGTVEAVSRTRPDIVLASFQVTEYPPAWTALPEDETALAGGVMRDEATMQVGVMLAEDQKNASLLAAFYQDGCMVELRLVETDQWDSGLTVLELDLTGYPEYDRAVLYLLSETSAPYCASQTVVE